MRFSEWESDVDTRLVTLFGPANISRSLLPSGLVVWRLNVGDTVTAGLENGAGIVYLSFSNGPPAILISIDAGTERAARYIATRLGRN